MMRIILLLLFLSVLFAVPITECTEITQPGNYELTTSLTGAIPNKDYCIHVASDGVTLNCVGNVIDGSGSQALYGIFMKDVENVEIKNCEVRNYLSHGIIITNSRNLVLESNRVFEVGSSTQGAGIWINGLSGSTIRFNKANNNPSGITIQNSVDNLIEDNIACGNANIDFAILSSSSGNIGSVMADKTNIQGNNQIDVSECRKTIDSCTTIDSPGEYALERDIAGAIPWWGPQKACIVVDANDVLLDCQGNSISYYGVEDLVSGIVVDGRSNVQIKDCVIDGFTEEGIGIYLSNDILVENNRISNVKKQGIDASTDNSVFRNNEIDGVLLSAAIGFAGVSNTIENNIISNSYSGIILVGKNTQKEADSNTIRSNQIEAQQIGIGLIGVPSDIATSNTVEDNTILGAATAIKLDLADNNIISRNVFTSSLGGLVLTTSSNNQIDENMGCYSSGQGVDPSFSFDASSNRNHGTGNTGSVSDLGNNPNFETEPCDFECIPSTLEVLPQDYIPVKVVAEDPNANLLKLDVYLFNTASELIASESASSTDPVASLEVETTFDNLPLGGYVLNASAEDEAGKTSKATSLTYYLAGSPCPSDAELEQLCRQMFPAATYDAQTGECSNPDGNACFTFDVAKCSYGIYFVDPTPKEGDVLQPGKVTIRAVVYDNVANIQQAQLGYVGPTGPFSKLFYPNSQEQIEVEVDLQKEGEYLLQASFVDEEGNYGLIERSISVSPDGSKDFGTLSISYDVLCPSGAYLFSVTDGELAVEGATITASLPDGTAVEATTDAEGKATLNLRSDTYSLVVGAEGFSLYEETLEVPALADRCSEDVVGAGHELSIKFVDPTPSEPFAPGTVEIAAEATDAIGDLSTLTLSVEDVEGNVISTDQRAVSGATASATLSVDLEEGAYVATATAEDASGLTSKTSRELIADANLGGPNLPPLAISADMDCDASFATFTVSSDGAPVEAATVFVGDGSQVVALTTDANGKASAEVVQGKDYYIRAWKEGYTQDLLQFSPLDECTQQFLDNLQLLYTLACTLNEQQTIDTIASLYSDSTIEVNAEVTTPLEQLFTGSISKERFLKFPVELSGEYFARASLRGLTVEKTLNLLTCDDAATFCIQQTLESVCQETPDDPFCSYLTSNDCLNAENPFLCSLQGYADKCSGSDAETDSCTSFRECLAENGINIDDSVNVLNELKDKEPSVTDAVAQNPQICAALILLALGAGFWFYKKYYA